MRLRRAARISVMLVAVAIGVGTVSGGTAGAEPPLVGAIRWDAWHPDNTTYPTRWVTSKLYTDWSTREPLQGWNLYGPGVDTRAIVRQEIDWAADYGLDYWAFVWYPENVGEPARMLMHAYNAYMASPNKSRLKFAFIVQTYWVAGDATERYWRSSYVRDFVNAFKDNQYVRVAGNRPVVLWFGTGQLGTQPDGFGTEWATQLDYLHEQTRGQLDAAGRPLGAPLLIDVTHDVAAASTYGLGGVASYGPAGAVPSASGNCADPRARSWSAQAAKDVANLSLPAPLLTVPSPTAVNDPRPRDADQDYLQYVGLPQGYGYWSQPPTYGQWEGHLQRLYDWALGHPRNTTDPALLLTYAWNELDEGGAGIVPTRQEQFKYLEAMRAVKTGRYPATHVDVYNADNCSIRLGGAGWIRYPGVSSAHDSDVQISWTPGDTAALTVQDATELVVRFNKGPDRGKVDVSVDGRPPTTVNLYSPSYEWWDYRSGALARGDHTIRLTVRGDRDARASFNQVPVDRISARIRRTAAWEFNTDGTLEAWSADHHANATVSGGALHLAATGPDAQLYNPPWGSEASLRLAARVNRYVHVRMRNNTPSTRATLYFLTDDDQSWGGTKAETFSIAPNSGYTEYVVDMAKVSSWTGTIRKLRIDPGDPSVPGGTYDIDFIRTSSG